MGMIRGIGRTERTMLHRTGRQSIVLILFAMALAGDAHARRPARSRAGLHANPGVGRGGASARRRDRRVAHAGWVMKSRGFADAAGTPAMGRRALLARRSCRQTFVAVETAEDSGAA